MRNASLVVVGTRITDDSEPAIKPQATRPTVSIYEGPNVTKTARRPILDSMQAGASRAGVRSFAAAVSPNNVGGDAWLEVTLSTTQGRRRRKVTSLPQLTDVKTSEGVIATAQAVNKTMSQHMSAQALLSHPKGTGIFVLSPDEVANLDNLNAAERDVLRPAINTADVLPYAAVLPPDPEHTLYLPAPPAPDGNQTDGERIRTPFDKAAMPAIGKHLELFRQALIARMEDSTDTRYVRPWWTLHDDRQDAIGPATTGDWATYCVTARWGGGGRLTVGLAPNGAIPKSGLHLLYTDEQEGTSGRHAAYLCGVFNSELFQQLAETMPPGHVRSAEIAALGLPALDKNDRDDIAATVTKLADAVKATALPGGVCDRFPELRDSLREDISLGVLPTAWTPIAGSPTSWGTVGSVNWLDEGAAEGTQAKKITDATIEYTIFGMSLRFWHQTPTSSGSVDFALPGLTLEDKDEQEALLAWAEGMADARVQLRHVADQPAPIDLALLLAQHQHDVNDLAGFATVYRVDRKHIEGILT